MNLFGMMDLSGSAMQAERVRAEVSAANMANAETTRTAAGGAYRRQQVVFAAAPPPNGFARSFVSAAFDETQPEMLEPIRAAGLSSTADGVRIAAVVVDPSPPLKRYDPSHPDAGPDGYVAYPDINPVTEMTDLMGATRAYGLNSSAVLAEKSMISSALELAKT